jgi:hypothetical protein
VVLFGGWMCCKLRKNATRDSLNAMPKLLA